MASIGPVGADLVSARNIGQAQGLSLRLFEQQTLSLPGGTSSLNHSEQMHAATSNLDKLAKEALSPAAAPVSTEKVDNNNSFMIPMILKIKIGMVSGLQTLLQLGHIGKLHLPPVPEHLQSGADIAIFLWMAIQLIGGIPLGAWGTIELHERAHASVLDRHNIRYEKSIGFPRSHILISDDQEFAKLQQLPVSTQIWGLLKPCIMHFEMALGSLAFLWFFTELFHIRAQDTIVYVMSVAIWGLLHFASIFANLLPIRVGNPSDGLQIYHLFKEWRMQRSA